MDATGETNAGMRDRLVEAAVRLLAEQGPAAVQARQLVREVGASTMAVYHYFGGMPQLLAAVIDEGFRRLDARLAAVSATDDPVTDIGRLALAYRAAAQENPHLYDLMFGLSAPGGHRPEQHGLPVTSESSAPQRAYGHLVDAADRAIRAGRTRTQSTSPHNNGASCTATSPSNWPATSTSSMASRRCSFPWASTSSSASETPPIAAHAQQPASSCTSPNPAGRQRARCPLRSPTAELFTVSRPTVYRTLQRAARSSQAS